jgi:hypothetical protein
MIKKLIFSLLIFTSAFTYSQNCTETCTWTISSADAGSYTVNAGQTLCITSDGIAKGTITLAGGIICNAGVIYSSSFSCNQGTINNYGTITCTGNLSLVNDSLTINNNTGGTINVLGTLAISNAGAAITNSDQATVNIDGTITMSAGTITNTGTMNYPDINKTGGTNTNNGAVNCCGN